MKINILILALASLLSPLQAATINAFTTTAGGDITGGSARAIYGLDGSAMDFGSGFIGVGFFSSLPTFASASGSVIESSFTRLGGSGQMGLTLGSFDVDGLFSFGTGGSISTAPSTNEQFIDEPIFVVIGDGSSIANSNGLLVLQSSTTFPEDPSSPINVDLQTGAGLTAIFGSDAFDGSSGILIPGQAFVGAANSYQIAELIPEPSAMLLTALGAFGLLLRRRR